MLRHSAECRSRGYAFAADPSQQLARMEGNDVVALIDGADYLMTNDYEKSLLQSKARLTDAQLLERVKVRVTTLGKHGVEIAGRDFDPIRIPIAREIQSSDPTGVGDGFRAGFFTALSWGLSLERAGQVGSLLATLVLETVGTQEYEVRPDIFVKRLAESYGDATAEDVQPHLAG
jgi:adenosine kinase